MIPMEERKNLSMLLVGESGDGKSEFILSFINSDDRKRIGASGSGQTTRTSMVYLIDCENKKPLSVKILMKQKERFCEHRLGSFFEKFDFKNRNDDYFQNGFKRSLIEDDAFFNHEEFSCSEEILDMYNKLFNNDFYLSISKKESKEDDSDDKYMVSIEKYKTCYKEIKEKDYIIDEKEEVDIEDCFELFLEWVYDKCSKETLDYIYKKTTLEGIDIKREINISEIDNIQPFLKTEEGELSYSSLIENVKIETSIADYYANLMNDIRIGKLEFIDTYGLNHDEKKKYNDDVVKTRYAKLLLHDFPNVDTVIYLRKAQAKPPTDLFQNIPLLYEVKPSIMAYICFSHIDNIEGSGKKAIDKMRKEHNNCYDDVYRELKENGVLENLIKYRIECIRKNIVEYCSMVGLGEEYDSRYLKDNKEQIKELFLFIRDKKHLGNALININKMSLKYMRDVLDISKIFVHNTKNNTKKSKFRGCHGQTTKALSNRLYWLKSNNVIERNKAYLGFDSGSPNYPKFGYWHKEIHTLVHNRFKNIEKLCECDWEKYLDGNKNAVHAIQEIFNKFMDVCIACLEKPNKIFTNNPLDDVCEKCNHKDMCIQEVLYQAKSEEIENCWRNTYWERLDTIYDFSSILKDITIKDKLQNIINKLYEDKFISLCRENNARILANEFKKDMSENEFEKKLDEYFNMDSNLDDDEKLKFDSKVRQYLN